MVSDKNVGFGLAQLVKRKKPGAIIYNWLYDGFVAKTVPSFIPVVQQLNFLISMTISWNLAKTSQRRIFANFLPNFKKRGGELAISWNQEIQIIGDRLSILFSFLSPSVEKKCGALSKGKNVEYCTTWNGKRVKMDKILPRNGKRCTIFARKYRKKIVPTFLTQSITVPRK